MDFKRKSDEKVSEVKMFKWIKDRFSDNEEILEQKRPSHEVEIYQESMMQREFSRERSEQGEPRSFRFPIIPDETKQEAVTQHVDIQKENDYMKAPRQNYQTGHSSLFLQEEAKKEKSHKILIEKDDFLFPERKKKESKPEAPQFTPPKAKEVRKPMPKPTVKKAFKPTQIPSPIYGFKQRPVEEKKGELLEEFQRKQNQERVAIEPTKEAKASEGTKSVESIVKPKVEAVEEVKVVVVPEANEEMTTEMTEVAMENSVIEAVEEVQETAILESIREEKDVIIPELVVEEIPEMNRSAEEVAPEVIEEPKETSSLEAAEKLEEVAKPSVTEEPKPRKRVVPYNVMMLSQDRRKMMRAKEQETEQVESQSMQQVPQEKEEAVQPVLQEKVEIEPLASAPALVVEEQSAQYEYPPESLLEMPMLSQENDDQWIDEQAQLLQKTLANFNVGAQVIDVIQGPSVTRFEIQPNPGVKVNKITNLADDIKLSLAAKDIRIEAPIPGKSAVGIEVPNRTSRPVLLSEILKTPEFQQHPSPLAVALGLDIAGNPIVTDIQKMPHGLIAGATGSGKSVCINSILLSILYKASPYEVKVMLIDPKMVELAPYNNIPHLVAPVITDVKAATAALKWAVEEMEKRYELFAHAGARDLARYNMLVEKHGQGEKLPYLVIIIDELADLMMVAPDDVEEAICRIAQKARACGIHLILATQRPSVDVITGLIKANIPTRLAFTVSSQIDSRTIIDTNGADKLLGRGDMLFLENGSSKPVRAQGVYVSDDEIEEVVSHAKKQMKPNFLFEQGELVTKHGNNQEADDELFDEACEYVVGMSGASASGLQRYFRIGYNRAARLIDMMEAKGIVSEAKGSKPRDILMSREDIFLKK